MTEPRLTEAQIDAAYKAWTGVALSRDYSHRAVIEAITEHVQYPSEPAQAGRCNCLLSDQSCNVHDRRAVPATPQCVPSEPRYTLDEIAAAIQAEGDRISWQGFGAETTFAKAVCARFSPAPPDRAVEAVKNLFQMRSDQRQFMGRTPEEIVAAVRQADAKTEGRA